MFQKFITIKQKSNRRQRKSFCTVFLFSFCFILSANAKADFSKCRDKEFQEKVEQVAKEEGVNLDELLSVVAHESRCNYFVIAWNLPRVPETARNKFFKSLEEAKFFAEGLIATGKYRVDIGIGQINYEANIKRKGWTLDEVLNPKTALNRVTQILKERSWLWYHSSNPFYAKQWRWSAVNALQQAVSNSDFSIKTAENKAIKDIEKIKNKFRISSEKMINFSLMQKNKKGQPPLLVYLEMNTKMLLKPKERNLLPQYNFGELLVYQNL